MVLKVFIGRDDMLKHFVAYFVEDFVNILRKRGWVILPDKKVMRTRNPEKDLKKALDGRLPDVLVFFWVKDRLMSKWNKSLKKLPMTTAYFAEDMHFKPEKDAMRKASRAMDAILVRYKEAAEHFLRVKKNHAPVYSIPHGAVDLFFKKVNWASKKRLCLLSGAVCEGFYPLRVVAEDLMDDGFPLIVRRRHPGYDKLRDPRTETKNYAKAISTYMMAIADAGVVPHNPHPYTLAKTFEICAAGTAMITHSMMKPYLKKLGFESGVHYIEATPKNLKDVVSHWLRPSQTTALKKITLAGQKLVKNNHTNLKRVEDFEALVLSLNDKKKKQHK